MEQADIGLIGLGTMGGALALNIAENGFRVAVWNRTLERTRAFVADAGPLAARLRPCETLEALVSAIAPPRTIILMVPAGDPVDQQIAALRRLLAPDDLIVDAGNANFHDTNRRTDDGDLPFIGIGVSGGEDGARNGPAIMGGGPRQLWDRVAPVLTAIAADFQGAPCANWMGEAGAGHFVKTVHNGIEYADMQLIAEIYGLQRDGMGLSAAEIGAQFTRWNTGPLASYLIEITATVAVAADRHTGRPILDVIVDAAGQKGTGRWTAIEAQHLGAPVPAIDAAVSARNLSARRNDRARGEELFGSAPRLTCDAPNPSTLEGALIAGKVLSYAQGFGMIARAAEMQGWQTSLPVVAKTWRAGCIIRSAMLDDMAAALAEDPSRNLIFAPVFAALLNAHQGALRDVVAVAARHGVPTPALAANLAYFDTMRMARGTANLIQAQRDYFGLHGFERIDGGSDPHGPWAKA